MSYKLDPNRMYMMPVHFGPMTGPRQNTDGGRFANTETPLTTSYSVSFLTDRGQLEELVPEGFEIIGEPVVKVFTSHMEHIEWLAGRGYNVLGVSFRVRYNGKKETAEGPFLTVLWENLTDPILTGREQLGFNKIYCELPEPIVCGGVTRLTASWLGFRFLDLKLANMTEINPEDYPKPVPPRLDGAIEGQMHYKYIPKTGVWGEADAAYPVISPSSDSNAWVTGMWKGEGTVDFHKAKWEDMPTQFRIVNAFGALEIIEYRGAEITQSSGGNDLYGQRILE